MGENLPNGNGAQTDPDAGVAYARVSDDRQVEDGYSLQDQKDYLLREATEREIPIVKTVTDGAETGTDFDREGIREIRHIASQESVSYVFVDEVDRIGRHAVETLYYLYELREECGTTIITNEAGELDVTDYHDLIYVVMRALSSQSVNETSTRRSMAARVQRFKNKNWSSVFNTVPLGYVGLDDGWIAIDPDEVDVVKEMFQNFLDADTNRAYTETIEETANLPEDMYTGKIRRFLHRPLYVGRPTTNFVDYTRNDESKTQTTVTDESLRIISDETFEAVQEKADKVREASGGSGSETTDMDSLVEEFGPVSVVGIDEIIQIRCPECDGQMRCNGRRDLKTRTVHNYQCRECGKQRKFPTQTEMDGLETGMENTSPPDNQSDSLATG